MRIESDDKLLEISGTERALLEIWKEILHTECTTTDKFLDLGGDSLAAMLCVARISARFDIDLELGDFFYDDGTISELAKIIDEEKSRRR